MRSFFFFFIFAFITAGTVHSLRICHHNDFHARYAPINVRCDHFYTYIDPAFPSQYILIY